jgi:glycerophosphoryl diester phosphodiesterase
LQQGADALELDVHLSADGIPVVIHDSDAVRTTGVRLFVSQEPVARLRELDAGACFTADRGRTFPWSGRGVTVPTLGEVMESFPETPLLIELKTPAAQGPVRDLIRRHRAESCVAVASEYHQALVEFRDCDIAVAGSRREIGAHWARTRIGLGAARPRCRILAVPWRWWGLSVPTTAFLRAAHQAGVAVHVWTVDLPSLALALWNRGAQGIVTNDPAAMVGARARLAA